DLRGEHVGARAAAEQQATRAAARREERLRALGIGAPREGNEGDEGDEDDEHSATPLTLDGARGAARSALEAARVELERLESQAEAARALLGELSAASARVARAGQLADDLRADRFLRYLLDEERTALSQLGSARFEMLSGGRYRFTDDGEFRIVDLANAEQERKAETLSGGETFLASLALALALAERVSGAGGRGLDAFFLDEGFGTLDAEHLELALEGIERLVIDAPRRLVALVSHVPALRERIDDRIELDRDPLTGNTRVQRGASAPQPHAESFVAAVGRRLATAPTPASTRTP
ncbi:MAG: hypothetical protein KC503_42605, partial [Myxococcales bacterium]|nr:hypothetical protein [Myxococcales bacterium]